MGPAIGIERENCPPLQPPLWINPQCLSDGRRLCSTHTRETQHEPSIVFAGRLGCLQRIFCWQCRSTQAQLKRQQQAWRKRRLGRLARMRVSRRSWVQEGEREVCGSQWEVARATSFECIGKMV
ncbi:hypothetical protein FHT26_005081 [Rhizobacter sp. SG703]|nr:hypothetical protein [Rhizobacter sp. SG703]